MHSSKSSGNNIGQPVVFGTFGTYRFVLASLVIMTHTLPLRWSFTGTYAVFAFYTLSGYVVSYILQTSYLPQPHGIRKYYLNRALRIYPSYWTICLLCALLVLFYPHSAPDIYFADYIETTDWKAKFAWWVLTLTLFIEAIPFIGATFKPVLANTPVWTVGIEMGYWLLMPALLVYPRLRRAVVIFAIIYTLFAISLSLYLGPMHNPYSIQLVRYYNSLAGSLPFCIGMLLLLRKNGPAMKVPHFVGITAVILFLILLVNVPVLFSDPYFIGAYISLGLNATIIAYLSQFDQRALPSRLGTIDSFLGNLSYPLFLVHIPVSTVLHLFLPDMGIRSFATFGYTLAVSIPAAMLLHYSIETPMNRVRQAIKC